MTPQECVNAIRDHFPEKCNEQMMLDLLKYIENLGFGPIQTDVFYSTIRDNYEHQHRYFPSMKAVQTIWGGRHGTGGFESHDFEKYKTRHCIEYTKHWSVMKIVKRVNAIRDGEKCNHKQCKDKASPCTTQIMFIRAWGELASIYGHLVDLEWENGRMMSYLDKIKETIISGQEPKFDIVFHTNQLDLKDDRDYTGKTQRPTKHIGEIMGDVL